MASKLIFSDWSINEKDRNLLRALASRVAAHASETSQEKKRKLWTQHNDLTGDTPLVFIDPENGWHEIIREADLNCTAEVARAWEMQLRKELFWAESLRDDRVTEPYFDVPFFYSDSGWGLNIVREVSGQNGSYKVKKAIEQYDRDFPKLHYPEITVNWPVSDTAFSLAHEIFDGLLTVRRKGMWWWSLGMCWDFIDLRGFEDFMYDMIDEPDYFHRMMEMMCSGQLAKIDFLEREKLLTTNIDSYVGSGGFGYTSQLPHDQICRASDMWGFVESQETSSVSPDMYGEFVLPYHIRMAERFGLNYYGCCEGYNTRWQYIRQLPRLRRVSVSPWADATTVPNYLKKDYVACIKIMPTPLAEACLDEDAVRADCRRAVLDTLGGICEFIMKDNHTLGGNPQNAVRWVEIMREEIDKVY